MTFEPRWHTAIVELTASDWDRLAAPLANPFLEWAWLDLLEETHCVGGETGWEPQHLSLWRDNRLVAVAPLYLKSHSWGEFVFDQEWARVAKHVGAAYYPKLVGMPPFTPAIGYGFPMDSAEDNQAMMQAMLAAIDVRAKDLGLGGVHLLHATEQWAGQWSETKLVPWLHHAMIWKNNDYASFDDFLNSFSSQRRKKIRRERRKLVEQGIECRVVPATEAEPELFELMFFYYASTCEKYWGGGRYLNLDFFKGLANQFSDRVYFCCAYGADRFPVAMSLLIRKDECLYGRVWGCRAEWDSLHFETCYYAPLQWAIEEGIQSFDAGSGSVTLKRRRGFPAIPKYSLHRFYHPVLDHLLRENINHINQQEQLIINEINGVEMPIEGQNPTMSEENNS